MHSTLGNKSFCWFRNLEKGKFIFFVLKFLGCYSVTVAVDFKVYDFLFRQEQPDFVPDTGFVPYFWRRKGNDPGNDGTGHDKPTDINPGSSSQAGSLSSNMDVDFSNSLNSSTTSGKSVLCSPVDGLGVVYAVTPFNPNPRTPKAVERR
jgi:hypothetical protein